MTRAAKSERRHERRQRRQQHALDWRSRKRELGSARDPSCGCASEVDAATLPTTELVIHGDENHGNRDAVDEALIATSNDRICPSPLAATQSAHVPPPR